MSETVGGGTSGVTIGDIVAEGPLEVGVIVMPIDGMSRPVSWVHATEQLDPRPHLRRDEIVCTLGSAIVQRQSARRFVDALMSAEVSGLALGLGEVHLAPPPALVEACEIAGLPLLVLPHGIPFRAVNDAILEHRTRIQNEARKQETHLLSQLMTNALDGQSEAELMQSVTDVFGAPAVSEASTPNASDELGPSSMFVEQLGSILELVRLEKERELYEKLLQMGQLITLIGEGLAHPAVVIPEFETRKVSYDALRVSVWPSGSETALADRWPQALLGVTDTRVVMIMESSDPARLGDLGLVCGFSATIGVSELRRGLNEARSAFQLARSRGGIAGPDSLVSLDALLEQQPQDRLAPFIEQLVTPLLDADAQGRGELVRTLTVYLDCNRQLQAAADALFIHVNTVRHRLSRVREISGRDPLSSVECTDLRIGLWAAERRRILGHRLIRQLG